MFVEQKEHGEMTQAEAETMKLSEAIRIGCPFVQENYVFSGCALAAGYFARTGRHLEVDGAMGLNYIPCVEKVFGVPLGVLNRASAMHIRGTSRQQVADWLESKGY